MGPYTRHPLWFHWKHSNQSHTHTHTHWTPENREKISPTQKSSPLWQFPHTEQTRILTIFHQNPPSFGRFFFSLLYNTSNNGRFPSMNTQPQLNPTTQKSIWFPFHSHSKIDFISRGSSRVKVQEREKDIFQGSSRKIPVVWQTSYKTELAYDGWDSISVKVFKNGLERKVDHLQQSAKF